MYFNQYDLFEAKQRCESHPVLSHAINFLEKFIEEVNSHSDGWAYWKAPSRAASKLVELIQAGDATEKQYRAALTPIKSFYTRLGDKAGMRFPETTLIRQGRVMSARFPNESETVGNAKQQS